MVLGRSVDGRPIVAVELSPAHPRASVLLVGCIHGDEPAGIEVARTVRHAGPIPGIDLWVIDDLNPDGVAAHTRQNAHGVDLNRNYPYRWRHRLHGSTAFVVELPSTGPSRRRLVRYVRAVRTVTALA